MSVYISYTGCAFAWVGVIRRDGKVVAECGHRHRNRDSSTQTSGPSARSCIQSIVRFAQYPDANKYRPITIPDETVVAAAAAIGADRVDGMPWSDRVRGSHE